VAFLVTAVFVIWGVVRMLRRRRLPAYLMFERALLIQIFIGQFFTFVELQFVAAFGFVVNLLLLITIRYMIRGEQHLERASAVATAE
jgi:predicted small integral membrane protein